LRHRSGKAFWENVWVNRLEDTNFKFSKIGDTFAKLNEIFTNNVPLSIF
jgi:hypothetical protein